MSNITIDYNKKDFLYYKYAHDTSTGREMYSCDKTGANRIKTGLLRSTCDNFPGLSNGSGPCSTAFTDALCNNKIYADNLLTQTINHSGADELYKNTISKYNAEQLNFINLGIGILVSCVVIITYKR